MMAFITERCPRCNSQQYHELDESHAFLAVKCIAGHTTGYIGGGGETTTIRSRDLPTPPQPHQWLRDRYGNDAVAVAELLIQRNQPRPESLSAMMQRTWEE